MAPGDPYFDWRIWFATTLAADLPAAFPGGPSHEAGAAVRVATVAGDARSPSFITPSSSALALGASIRAAEEADDRRTSLSLTSVIGPDGRGISIADESTSALYDFFERAYVAIVFSYQAIEAYANEQIAGRLTAPIEMSVRGRIETLDAESIERWIPTSQKLVDVLPALRNVASPKKALWWPSFKELERLRDATVHLKAGHAYPRATSRLRRSYFHELLAAKSIRLFPQIAVRTIGHFETDPPRPGWLLAAEALATGAT